jgi:hypothetical protein
MELGWVQFGRIAEWWTALIRMTINRMSWSRMTLDRTTHSWTIFGRMTLARMTNSRKKFSTTLFGKKTLRKMTFYSMTIDKIVLSVLAWNRTICKVWQQIVSYPKHSILLNAVLPSVVAQNVVAPFFRGKERKERDESHEIFSMVDAKTNTKYPVPSSIKLFASIYHAWRKHFCPSLIFEDKAGRWPLVEHRQERLQPRLVWSRVAKGLACGSVGMVKFYGTGPTGNTKVEGQKWRGSETTWHVNNSHKTCGLAHCTLT